MTAMHVHLTSRPRRRSSSAGPRSGVATVEFAVCLPIMLLITFGSIEAANSIYLKQMLTQAAYEGARVGTTPGATSADAEAIARQILDARSVQGATIVVAPTVTSTTPSGAEITVTVTAPANSNSFAPLWYFKNATLQARVVMIRN